MRWLHIKDAHIFAPENLGILNVTIWNGQIVSIGEKSEPPSGVDTKIIEAEGRPLLPGLIDPHAHIMGASGVGGPLSRSAVQP